MAFRSDAARIGSILKGCHWITAILVLALVVLGLLMTGIEDTGSRLLAYRWHLGIGVSVLALTLGRLIWRFIDRPPPAPALNLWECRLARRIVQAMMYVLLFALPAGGLATLATTGALPAVLGQADPSTLPVTFELAGPRLTHRVFFIGLIAFAVFHAAAAFSIIGSERTTCSGECCRLRLRVPKNRGRGPETGDRTSAPSLPRRPPCHPCAGPR